MTCMIPRTSTRLHFGLIAGVLAAVMVLATMLPGIAVAYQPTREGHGVAITPETEGLEALEPWMLASIQPEHRDRVAAMMPENLPEYEIAIELVPGTSEDEAPRLEGVLELRYVNTISEEIDALPFRLYANGPAPDNDAVTISEALVDGEVVEPSLSVSGSVLEIPFDGPLAPGDSAIIAMTFTTVLPIDSSAHYGIFNYSSTSGTWALAHWYPVIAGRDPVTGWVLDYPSRNGDPIFSDTALFDVSITAPAGWSVVTTGVEFGDPVERDAAVSQRYVSGPVRDFTIVADPELEVTTREIGGTTVKSWYNPGQEVVGEAVADYAAQALELFNELLGPYPYTDLDLVPVDMFGAAGCEFPALIYMATDYYEGNTNLEVPNSLDFTVAHEVVHQWFYGLVGNNQYAHAFIDEGLTQHLSADVYFAATYDESAAATVVRSFLTRPFERVVHAGDDQIVNQPTDGFDASRAYAFAAYVKAPLGFAAIHEEIGDDAFFGALQAYVDAFTFLVATPDDLLAAFEDASNEDLGDLWRHWFEEASGEDDIDP